MILFVLPLLCLVAADATPRPTPRPGIYGIDGVQGVLYEFPEYEDPDMALFQLTAKGAMPVLTVLEVARESEDSPKQEDSTYNEQLIDLLKKDVDDVIARLHVARSKLEMGNTQIFIDVDKSIHCLKNIEHLLYSKSTPSDDSSSRSSSVDLNDESNDGRVDGQDFTTEQETTTTETEQETTTTEIPSIENSHDVKKMLAPSGGSILITETNKYEDNKKASLRKKWTWKSSSIV